jgi:hypothetical protein
VAFEVSLLRRIRHSRAIGELPLAIMRQLPLYAAHSAYLDEQPELMVAAVAEELQRRQQSREAELPSDHSGENPPVVDWNAEINPREIEAALDIETRKWLEEMVVIFALGEDLYEPPCAGLTTEEYAKRSLPRVREFVKHAIDNGAIPSSAADLGKLSWWVLLEVRAVRNLRQDWSAGKIPRKERKQNPRFRVYKEYFHPSKGRIWALKTSDTLGAALYEIGKAEGN